MSNINLEHLKNVNNETFALLCEMYMTNSRSGHEEKMSEIVRRELDNMGIPYDTKENMIYAFHAGQPILSAHMDQVQSESPTTVRWYKDKEGHLILAGVGREKAKTGTCDKNEKKLVTVAKNVAAGLGADDKNGVWTVLRLLKRFPNASFCFSQEEETCAGKIDDVLKEHEDLLKTVPFALVFDRKGSGDIVGNRKGYCNKEFEIGVAEIGKGYGYVPCGGVFSDGDFLCKYTETVNLSVGYENAHSDTETTCLEWLDNAVEFGAALVEGLCLDKRDGKDCGYTPDDSYDSLYRSNRHHGRNRWNCDDWNGCNHWDFGEDDCFACCRDRRCDNRENTGRNGKTEDWHRHEDICGRIDSFGYSLADYIDLAEECKEIGDVKGMAWLVRMLVERCGRSELEPSCMMDERDKLLTDIF